MVTRGAKRQVKLLESYKKVAKADVRRDAEEGKCVPMSQADSGARQWELCEQQRAWQEALEHENLITYRKQSGTAVLGLDPKEVELSLESNTDWSQEGDKFVKSIAQLLLKDRYMKFSSWVTADLANIVYNNGKHSLPDLSHSALRLLKKILDNQPPVAVGPGPLEMDGMASKKPPPPVLLTPPAELEPWAGLPGCRAVGSEQTAAQAYGKSLRSASSKRVTTRPKPAKYGAHWLVEEVPKWVVLVEELVEESDEQQGAVPPEFGSTWGSVMLVDYLLQAWQVDLDARVQVVQSHSRSPKQQKQSQQILTVSYAHRALEDVASHQAQALLDKCWNIIATLPPSAAGGALMGDTPVGQLAQDMLQTVQRFVRLVFKLLGAAEDIGLSQTSTSFCQCAMKRQALDVWMMKVFHVQRGPGQWPALLLTLEPRDRMRFLSLFLSHRYHLMNFAGRDVAKHQAASFVQPGELYASVSTDAPATFVDMAPGTTMHVLCTGDMLGRFFKAATAFHMDCNCICVFVHHLCKAAVAALPALIGDNRFKMVRPKLIPGVPTRAVVLEPLQHTPKCYSGTYGRFEKANQMTASQQREACSAEFTTMQRGVLRVVKFLGELARKGTSVESMHIEECGAADRLQVDMLRCAEAAGIITRRSSEMLVAAHAILQGQIAHARASGASS
eukprot:jgi/Ulvmu1/9355/UM050_0107.1